MLVLETFILAGGAKEFFENPAYLIGIPLLALGVIGLLIALAPFRDPERPQEEEAPKAGKDVPAAGKRPS